MTLSLALVLIAAVSWVGVRGLIAKAELEQAIPLASTVKGSLVAGDRDSTVRQTKQLISHTTVAAGLTSDPLWRAAEFVPLLGPNLTAFREASAVVEDVAVNALKPIADLAGALDISSLRPVDGKIDLAPIKQAQTSIHRANDVVTDAITDTKAIDVSQTLGQVDDAVAQLLGVLEDANSTIGQVRTVIDLVPGLLGDDGPRNYLLLFQNNAELRSLGGNPASLALMAVDGGSVDMVQQASSQDFPSRGTPAMDLGATYDLYANNLPAGTITGYIQDVTAIPDFPTAAQLGREMWMRDLGGQIDGVAGFDPVALSYLLAATGPLTMSTGDVLSAENVVPLMLSEIYFRYPDGGPEQDAFFAEAARGVFNLVKSGAGDPKALVDALMRATTEGRLMFWSSLPAEQDFVLTTPLSGVLPASNEAATVAGVFVNDWAGAKFDYYLDAAVDVAAPVCTAEAGLTTVSTITLTSTVPTGVALPGSVTGINTKREMYLDIIAIGPVGGSFTSFDGGSTGAQLVNTGMDKSRPVARLFAVLPPGQSTTVTVTMTTPPGDFGPLTLKTTPMVRPTAQTVAQLSCTDAP